MPVPLSAVFCLLARLGAASTSPETTAPVDEPVTDVMHFSLDDLLDVEVVSATKAAQKLVDAPSVVTVLHSSVLVRHGYRSVGEALREVPGLYVINDYVAHNIGVRGVAAGIESWSRTIKVLVDGQPVTFHTTGGNLLGIEALPLSVIERVEVIRGPASALYGANAFLGVINIITRTPSPGVRAAMLADLGSFHSHPGYGASVSVEARADHQRGWLRAAATGAHIDRSGLEVDDSSPRYAAYKEVKTRGDRSKPRSYFVQGSKSLSFLGDMSFVFLQQRLITGSRFVFQGTPESSNRVALQNDVWRLQQARSFPVFDGTMAVQTGLSLSESKTLPKHRTDAGHALYTSERRRSTDTQEWTGQVSYAQGRSSLLAGVDHRRMKDTGDTIFHVQRVGSDAGDRRLNVAGERNEQQNTGVYVQGAVYWDDWLGVTAGLRHDVSDQWDASTNTRLGVSLALPDDLHLKLLYGSSFVPPAPAELYTAPLGAESVEGNPTLEPQRAKTFEVAVTYAPSSTVSVEVNGYRTAVNDRIEFATTGLNQVAMNQGSTTTWGGEVLVRVAVRPVYGELVSSLSSSSIEPLQLEPSWWETVYGDIENSRLAPRLPSFPTWHGFLRLGSEIPALDLDASIAAFVAGARRSTASNSRAGVEPYLLNHYIQLDLSITYAPSANTTFLPGVVSLHVKNLLNERGAEPGYRGLDVPRAPRSVFLRYTHSY